MVFFFSFSECSNAEQFQNGRFYEKVLFPEVCFSSSQIPTRQMLCSAVPTLPESRRMFICDQIAFQFTGKSCECDQNSVGRTSTENCHPPNSTELCSDRGECVCGQCKCDDQHLGVLCECRVDACPRGSDGQVGSGLAILVDQNCPILTR